MTLDSKDVTTDATLDIGQATVQLLLEQRTKLSVERTTSAARLTAMGRSAVARSALIGAAAALSSCTDDPEDKATPSPAAYTLEVLHDAGTLEDLIEINDTGILIGSGAGLYSGAEHGMLAAIDTKDRSVIEAWPGADAPATLDAARFPDCPSTLGPTDLSPHGLFAAANRLWVVNHGSRESIETFDITGDADRPLRWIGCIPLPEGANGNGVTVSTTGTVYVTHYFDPSDVNAAFKALLAGESTGNVRVWNASEGWSVLPGSDASGPNGIALSSDGTELWFSAWGARELIHMELASGALKRLAVPFMPDNLRWGDDGRLYTTGQDLSPEDITPCLSSDLAVCPYEGFTAIAVDPTAFESEVVFETTTHEFGHASVALPVSNGEIWLGTVFGGATGVLVPAR